MSINIAIDLLSTKYGGGKYYILNQLKEFSNYGNKYKIICIVSDTDLQNEINDLGYKTIFLKSDNLIQSILYRMIIFSYILKKKNIDLVYYPNNFINPFSRYKSIVLFQNVKVFGQGLDSSNVKEGLKYYLLKLLSKYSIKKADRKVYVSNEIRRLAMDYNKSRVIYSGKTNWNVSKSSKKENYALNVSTSDSSQKNIKVLIDGFKLFNRNNKDISLKIIGNIREESKDNIQYVGYVNNKEIQEYYSKALICISPSIAESFGFTPMEAMIKGTPCILSDISIFHEIYGNAALYFNPYSPEDLSDKINTLVKNKKLYNELVEKGFKQIEKYSWEKNVREFIEVFDEIYKKNS